MKIDTIKAKLLPLNERSFNGFFYIKMKGMIR